MPWQETHPMLERHHFVLDYDSGHWTMTELCTYYGVSRNTRYKWLDHYHQSGIAGLRGPSRAPRSCPHPTPEELVQLILAEHARYGWGARKVFKRLGTVSRTAPGPGGVPSATSSRAMTASPHVATS